MTSLSFLTISLSQQKWFLIFGRSAYLVVSAFLFPFWKINELVYADYASKEEIFLLLVFEVETKSYNFLLLLLL
jgi:hypothetical protein